ncbi:hypothetical protein SKAU_G00138900 [Synaphobranchus kaupii]|uniref:Uncharacterized protein n=1 Tax=Synaphobranchus kaupii TaxID=118154 RepID=A0A9Q1J340_SYNKA|nr:hypothetical protein SKAU_G00138900 [Synaphobranchus kaupii]
MLQSTASPSDNAPPQHSQINPQQHVHGQAIMLDCPAEVSRRPRHQCPAIQQHLSHGAKPSPQSVQQRWPWLGLDKGLQEPMCTESLDELHHVSKAALVETECQRPMELKRSSSAQRIPRTISASLSALYRQGSMSSSFTETRVRAQMSSTMQIPYRQPMCTRISSDRNALQSLFIISTPAPLIQRPDLLQPPRKTHQKIPAAQARMLGGMVPRLSNNSRRLAAEEDILPPQKRNPLYYEFERKKKIVPVNSPSQ